MGIKPINAGVPMHAWKMDADDDDEFPSVWDRWVQALNVRAQTSEPLRGAGHV